MVVDSRQPRHHSMVRGMSSTRPSCSFALSHAAGFQDTSRSSYGFTSIVRASWGWWVSNGQNADRRTWTHLLFLAIPSLSARFMWARLASRYLHMFGIQ